LGCSKKNTQEYDNFCFKWSLWPRDLYVKGNYGYVLDNLELKIISFKDRKIVDKIRYSKFGDHWYPHEVIVNNNQILLLLTNLYKIALLENKKVINIIDFDFLIHDFIYYKQDTLLLLGQDNGYIFHLYNLKGNKIKDFGKFPEKIAPQIGPRNFWVQGDTIYTAGINGYKIYRYINEELNDYFIYPDTSFIKGITRKEQGGVENIFLLSGLNGVVEYRNNLYISTFCHEPITRYKAKTSYYLDVFNIKSKELLEHTKYDSIIVPVCIDNHYLYLIKGNSLLRMRN